MGRPTGPIGLTRAFVSWAGLGWAQPWLGLGRVGLALFGPGLAHWKAWIRGTPSVIPPSPHTFQEPSLYTRAAKPQGMVREERKTNRKSKDRINIYF